MRVFIEPETGQITGNVDPNAVITLDAETQNALRYDDTGLTVEKHANGTLSVNLQERYQNASVAHIGANGRVIICTDNIADVERSLNGQTSTPAPLEVK
jgi:hypothetical protein